MAFIVAGTTNIEEATPRATGAPRRQGRYVLGDLLGRGGMAEVFAGHALGSHGFQKPVAVKRLLPELANDHVFVERLIEEAKLVVGMQHGNIVSVLDLAREGEDVFLVMEFVDGPTLRQLLKSRGARALPLGVAAYVIQAAAAGLEFAHARPGGAVIHADISPSNLLLTTSGEVRVADFGIARREGRMTGMVEGKWAYMAPEQARGESLTPRSDVFALGVVLYELITGQHPIGLRVTPESRGAAPARIIPPRMLQPGLPVGLDAICMKALAHDPDARYARMQHLIDALGDERFANGWREGAAELAQLIRAMKTATPPAEPRTQVTDRPVTLHTRSLISSSARTAPPAPAAAAPRGSEPTLALAAAEVARSHDLPTVNGRPQLQVIARRPAWKIAVLGAAAVAGSVAAVLIQRTPSAIADPGRHAGSAPAALADPGRLAAAAPSAAPLAGVGPILAQAAATPAAPPPAPALAPAVAPEPARAVAAVAPHVPPPAAPVPHHAGRAARPAPAIHHAAPDATLRVQTYDEQWVAARIGSQLAYTPGAKFHLAPGSYIVRLENDTYHGTCRVSLAPGQTRTLVVNVEGGACELR